MDGNGRWAKRRMLPRIAGHKKGLDTLEIVVKCAITYKIQFAYILLLLALWAQLLNKQTSPLPSIQLIGMMQR